MIAISIYKRQAWAKVNFHWRSVLESWCLIYQICEYCVVIRHRPWQNRRFRAFPLLSWLVSVLAQQETVFETAFSRLLSAFELKSFLSRKAHSAPMMILYFFPNDLKGFFSHTSMAFHVCSDRSKIYIQKKDWFLVFLLWLLVVFFSFLFFYFASMDQLLKYI